MPPDYSDESPAAKDASPTLPRIAPPPPLQAPQASPPQPPQPSSTLPASSPPAQRRHSPPNLNLVHQQPLSLVTFHTPTDSASVSVQQQHLLSDSSPADPRSSLVAGETQRPSVIMENGHMLTALDSPVPPTPVAKDPPIAGPAPQLPPRSPTVGTQRTPSPSRATLVTVSGTTHPRRPSADPLPAPPSNSTNTNTLTSSASRSDLPELDFEAFLAKMRHPSAYMLTRYFKSFLREFQKKRWTPTEQTKIVLDFIQFSVSKMPQCEPWQSASPLELDVAREGMEKLVMTKLYGWTFCPAGTNDAALDREIRLKMKYFRWVREEHLDIPDAYRQPTTSGLEPAMKELSHMNRYKAPRDKLVCVMNCCKLIMGFMQTVNAEAGADDFVPMLIFTVLKANPLNLISNVQYIARFRNPDKLQSETGYYLTNLMGAISFIEKMDQTCLTVDPQEYDRLMTKSIMDLEEEESKEVEERRREAALSPPTQTLAHPQQPKSRSLSGSDSEMASPASMRILQKPLSMLNRWFGGTTTSPPGGGDSANAAARKTPGLLSPVSPVNILGAPDMRVADVHPGNVVTTNQNTAAAEHSKVEGKARISTVPGNLTSTKVGSPPAESQSPPVDDLVPEKPRFERKLSREERTLLNDFDLQLAMALSLSMEKEGGPSSKPMDSAGESPSMAALQVPRSLRKVESLISLADEDAESAVGNTDPAMFAVPPTTIVISNEEVRVVPKAAEEPNKSMASLLDEEDGRVLDQLASASPPLLPALAVDPDAAFVVRPSSNAVDGEPKE